MSNLGRKVGFHPRRTVNDAYFDAIDTEAKAYWLGFITADGYVSDKQVKLRLSEVDSDHVYRFRDALGSDAPITFRDKSGFKSTHRGVDIAVSSVRLVTALRSLGLIGNKSLTVEPWSGPSDLIRHYWRGAFDGDGGIWQTPGRDYWHMSFIGSRPMAEAFRDFLRMHTSSVADIRAMGKTWSIQINGRVFPRRLAVVLYEGATVALVRKQTLALQLIATDPSRSNPWISGARERRLSDADVIQIRQLRAQGLGYRKIACRFGVNFTVIADIVTGKIYRHVP